MANRHPAFEKGKPFLKGALHCHTTRSDGSGAPEDVIRLHHAEGYQFMALTDHNKINHINYADVPMTMLSGIERDMALPGPSQDKPICVHVVGVGVPHDPRTPEQDYCPERYPASAEPGDAQGMIDEMHAWGMKTIYAHPEWSGTKYADFRNLKGNFAMEVWNTGCVLDNGLDENAPYWDEAWDDGNEMWGVATDDGHPMHQHCKGWVMVSSDNDAESILSALEKGEFYASCGPEIYDFYEEDGKVVVKCSPVQSIQFVTLRYPLRKWMAEEGTELTEAYTNPPAGTRYVRATVVDAKGRRAWTNPLKLR